MIVLFHKVAESFEKVGEFGDIEAATTAAAAYEDWQIEEQNDIGCQVVATSAAIAD
jgi:hypothetical protein